MQETTPSQAEGERRDDSEERHRETERTTPSQAEGEREPEDEHGTEELGARGD
ncbi:hypothetical protein ACFYZ9_40095 [Streptomyces sp. NPDC001691]|uniref:hypothetical protein n=1 Tax=Streptomyces sp. NPDC001691 TaxID=3364600 RepID=UPI00367EA8D3